MQSTTRTWPVTTSGRLLAGSSVEHVSPPPAAAAADTNRLCLCVLKGWAEWVHAGGVGDVLLHDEVAAQATRGIALRLDEMGPLHTAFASPCNEDSLLCAATKERMMQRAAQQPL